jgi:hypothetical protein
MITSNRLNQIHDTLKANPGMAISRMYNDRWSYTGCASHRGFWFTTQEIRELWVGGMIEEMPVNGHVWDDDNRFKYGSFRFDPSYSIPGYLEDFDRQPCWMS